MYVTIAYGAMYVTMRKGMAVACDEGGVGVYDGGAGRAQVQVRILHPEHRPQRPPHPVLPPPPPPPPHGRGPLPLSSGVRHFPGALIVVWRAVAVSVQPVCPAPGCGGSCPWLVDLARLSRCHLWGFTRRPPIQ